MMETSRRTTLVDEISRQTGITEAIADLVDTFYGRVRQDPLLAPVLARVENWDDHLVKLRAFWSSVVLMSGRYHGQPMQAHFSLSIEPRHFDRWLAVRADDGRCLSAGRCGHLHGEKARRIADSFETAMATRRGEIAGRRHSKSTSTPQRSTT